MTKPKSKKSVDELPGNVHATVEEVGFARQKPKNPGGRPVFVPTKEQRHLVKQLSAYGIPHVNICVMIGKEGKPIDVNTLKKHFQHELDIGLQEANAKMAAMLFKNGMQGNIAAQIFWMKTRAKWRELPTEIELSGRDNGAPIVQAVMSVDEYRETLKQVLSEY